MTVAAIPTKWSGKLAVRSCLNCCRRNELKNEPVFITKNGSGHLVVMSMDTYDKQMGVLDVYRKLGAAEAQIEDGVPLLEGKEVFQRLRQKHGE